MGIFIEKSRGERTGDASTILFPNYMESVQKQELIQKAKDLKTGDFVSWNSSGGRAKGKIVRIVRDGKINVPDSSFTINGTEEDPAVLIQLYRAGKEADVQVGHKMSTLTQIESMEKAESVKVGEMVSWNNSGGRATGKVIRVIADGSKFNVPNSSFKITGTKEEPAAVIRLYRDGEPTGTIVAHKVGTLTKKSVQKAQPGMSGVHVDAVMGGKKKKKKAMDANGVEIEIEVEDDEEEDVEMAMGGYGYDMPKKPKKQ